MMGWVKLRFVTTGIAFKKKLVASYGNEVPWLFRYMNEFDRAIMHLDKAFGFVAAPHQWVSRKDENDKLLVVERGDLVIVFNFHPVNSYTDYRIGCFHPGPYKVVLSSDEKVFGGYENVTKNSDVEFFATLGDHDNRPHSFQVYAPCRTVSVYAPSEFCDKDAEGDEYGIPGLAVRGLGPYFEL
jgi:1,4-alpha-glucan branching enzyme